MKTLVSTAFFLFSLSAVADSYYPTALPVRVFGSDQDVGSCMGEAIVSGLEHKLATTGGNFRISVQHIHNFNWKDLDNKKPSIGLDMTSTSLSYVNSYGAIVPDYILPEDMEGVTMSYLGTTQTGSPEGLPKKQFSRPRIEDMGIYNQQLAPQSYGYSRAQYTFAPKYSNSRTFAHLMSAVKSKQVVAFSFDADLMYGFDNITGMLAEEYVATDKLFDTVNHLVAIVGYDDELGGFIIRNSWNSNRTINAVSSRENSESEKLLLNKFKYKISKKNLPGYYLFPYKYVQDLAARNVGGFEILSMDYGKFANTYQEMAPNFEVINSFYSCNKASVVKRLKSLRLQFDKLDQFKADSVEYSNAIKIIKREIYKQISVNGNILPFAKQVRQVGGGIDRVQEFYQGKFADYYCGNTESPIENFWPLEGKERFVTDQTFKDFLTELSKDKTNLSLWFDFYNYLSKEVETL